MFAILALTIAGCAAHGEGPLRDDLRRVAHGLASPGDPPAERLDGSLGSYVRYASAQAPELRAGYLRWRAATLRIEGARQLPEPTLMYGFYFGPDMHQLAAAQELPWPTRLTAAADAQAHRARASQRRFEAQVLALRARVAAPWWRLWAVRQTRGIQREQLGLANDLAEVMRARLEVGQGSLADLAQLDLLRSRLEDGLLGLDEEERIAEAALRAAIGAPRGVEAPTTDEVPPARLPADDEGELAEALSAHPALETYLELAAASEAEARSIEGRRLPSLRLGVEWMFDHDRSREQRSMMEGVIASIGVSVPLWQGAYEDAQRAAEAEAGAERADREAAENAARAELTRALSALRDSHRRAQLYEHTLMPQAQGAYESVVGAYTTGEASIASVLLALRELLDLSVATLSARAEHGVAWGQLEAVVGRAIPAEAIATEAIRGETSDE